MSTCSGSITVSRSITTSLRSMETTSPVSSSTKSSIHVFNTRAANFTSHHLLEVRLVHLHVFRQIKNLENVLVILKSDGSQQSGNRQFLLTVNVRIHDVVDVGGKLNPRTLERMIRAEYNLVPLACTLCPKNTPGER